MDQTPTNSDGKKYLCSFHGSSSKPCCVSCECSNLTEDQWKVLNILAAETLKKDQNLNSVLPQPNHEASHPNAVIGDKPNQLLLDNWKGPQEEPVDISGWKTIEIYVFSNGQHDLPPRKYLFQTEDLHWWDATKNYIGRCHYGVDHSAIELYTLDGVKVETPLQLCNGAAYVVVEAPASFQSAGYAHYMNKALRSRIKREEKLKQAEDCNSITGCGSQSSEEFETYEIIEQTLTTKMKEIISKTSYPPFIEEKLVTYHNVQTIISQKHLPNITIDTEAMVTNPCFCYSAYSDLYGNAYIDYTIANIQSKNELTSHRTCRNDCMDHVNIATVGNTRYNPNFISAEENIKEDSIVIDNNLQGENLGETLSDIIIKDAIKSGLKQEYARQSKADKLARKPIGTVKRTFGSTERNKTPELNKSPRISNTSPRKTFLAKDDTGILHHSRNPNTPPKNKISADEQYGQTKPIRENDKDVLDHESLSDFDEDTEDKCKKSDVSKASNLTQTIASSHQTAIMPVTIANIKSPGIEKKNTDSRTKEINKACKIEDGSKCLGHSHLLKNITSGKANSKSLEQKKITAEKINAATNNRFYKSSRERKNHGNEIATESNKNYEDKFSSKSKPDANEKSPLTPRKTVIPKVLSGVKKKPNSPITPKIVPSNRPMSGKDRKVRPMKNNTAKGVIQSDKEKTPNKLNKQKQIDKENETMFKEHLIALTDLNKIQTNNYISSDMDSLVGAGENKASSYKDAKISTEVKPSEIEEETKVVSPLDHKDNTITIEPTTELHEKYSPFQTLSVERAQAASLQVIEIKDEATSFTRSDKGSQVEIEIPVIDREQQVIYPIVLRRKSTNPTRSPSGNMHPVDEILQFIVVKSVNESASGVNDNTDNSANKDEEMYKRQDIKNKSAQEIIKPPENFEHKINIEKNPENAIRVLKKSDHVNINKENIVIKDHICKEKCECIAQCERLYDLDDDTYDYFRLVKGTFVKIYINKNEKKDQETQEENNSRNEETQYKISTLEKNTNVDRMVEEELNNNSTPTEDEKPPDEPRGVHPVQKQAADEIQFQDVSSRTDDRNPFSLFKVHDLNQQAPAPVSTATITPSATPAASNVTRESTQPFTPLTLTSVPNSPPANLPASVPQQDTNTTYRKSYPQSQDANLLPALPERKPVEVATQTSWSNLMLVPKLHSDGHISLHIPPLSAVKHNMYHAR